MLKMLLFDHFIQTESRVNDILSGIKCEIG
jgi:hypothetical protein